MRREIPIALAIVAAAVGVAVADANSGVRTWLQVRRDLAVAQARVAELEKRIESREGETESLRKDPLARRARDPRRPGAREARRDVVRGLSGTRRHRRGRPRADAGGVNPGRTPRNP